MKRPLALLSFIALVLSCTTEEVAPESSACEGESCPPPDAGVKKLGEGCQAPEECSSALCVQVAPSEVGGKVCSQDCASQGCPVGWQCGGIGERRACLCTRQPENCDGQDNDCDGVVDGPTADATCGAAHPGEVCDDGKCTCLLRCGERCVDPRSDGENCGGCGKSCGGSGSCVDGACKCNPLASVCDGACIATANDPKNCGACGNACGPAEGCFAGKCVCRFVTCGGRCTDTTSDKANCGECGTTCGGACRTSTCEAQTLLSGRADPADLTANASDLFWLDRGDGRVERCPIGSCSAMTAVTLETLAGVQALAAGGRYVFWGNDQLLRRYDSTTQAITTVATTTFVTAITTDAAHVYWRDGVNGTVLSCALDGDCTAGATKIAEGLPTVGPSILFGQGPMVVTDGKIFFAYSKRQFGPNPGYPGAAESGIHVCPTSGCTSIPPPVFHRLPRAFAYWSVRTIGASNGRVYWSQGDFIDYPADDPRRYTCPTTGCEGEPELLRDVDDVSAVEGSRFFWVEAIAQPKATPQHRLYSCEIGETLQADGRRIFECKTPKAALLTAMPITIFNNTLAVAKMRPRTELVVRQGFVYFTEPSGTLRRVETNL